MLLVNSCTVNPSSWPHTFPRLSCSVNAAMFRCMPASLARFTALFRNSAREFGLLVAQQIGYWRGAVFVSRLEGGMRGGGVVVPGTDLLADVASEGDCRRAARSGSVAAVLDGCVADAALRGDRAIGEGSRQ